MSRNVARFKPSGGTLSERPCAGIASNVMNSILSFLPQLFLFFLFLCVFNHSSFFAARELRSDGGGLFPVVLLNNLTGVKLHYIYIFFFFRISSDLVLLFCSFLSFFFFYTMLFNLPLEISFIHYLRVSL